MNEPLNLTLPVYAGVKSERGYMSAADSAVYDAWEEARNAAIVALIVAISPDLPKPDASPSWREIASFSNWHPNACGSSLSVGIMKTGQIEVIVKRGYRRDTFRRFAVSKDGAIDPRIVEGVRELVARVKQHVQWEIESRERSTNATCSSWNGVGYQWTSCLRCWRFSRRSNRVSPLLRAAFHPVILSPYERLPPLLPLRPLSAGHQQPPLLMGRLGAIQR